MLIGLHHVGRIVTDLPAMVDDLAALTSWPIEIIDGPDALVAGRPVLATARAAGPNGWIELVAVEAEPATRREVSDAGVTHAAIQVGRIESVLERLDAIEMDRHGGPVELGTGYKYLYARDTEQLVTEVEGAPHAPADLEPWLSHGAIATADLDRLRLAYEGLLGTSATNTVRLRGHPALDRVTALDDVDVTATWVPAHNASVEMWSYHRPATEVVPPPAFEAPGSGHLAFETDDLGQMIERGLAAGFSLEDDRVELDGVRLARLRDPDGNWVELLEFADIDDPRSLTSRPDLARVARMDALLGGGG